MGEGYKIKSHPNQAKHYANDVSEELCKHHVRSIAQSWVDDKQCYVVGMGKCSAKHHKQLALLTGVDLIWSGSYLPVPLRVISRLVGSHSALYKLGSVENLEVLFMSLTEFSMAGIYFFKQKLVPSFEAAVIKSRTHAAIDYGVREDAGYFYYVVDGDNYESKTGRCEIVSIGRHSSFLETNF